MRRFFLLFACAGFAAAQVQVETAAQLQQRAELLREMIRRDPARALSLALPDEALTTLRARFPGSSAIETRGEWEGPLTVIVADDFEHRRSRTVHQLRLDDGRLVQVHGAGYATAGCGRRVRVTGIRLGDEIAALSATDTGAAVAAGGCLTLGQQKVAVLIVNYPNTKLPGWVTPAAMQSMYLSGERSMSEFWRENSYGLTWASGAVFGPFLLATDYGCGQFMEMADAAVAAAGSALDPATYTRIMIVAPAPGAGCEYVGISTVGCTSFTSATQSSFQASASALSVRTGDGLDSLRTYTGVAYHESGHGLGLAHARSLDFDTVALGPPGMGGVYGEYGDIYSNMGDSEFHWAAPHKAMLGWLSNPGNIQQLVPGGAPVPLYPYETPALSTQAAKVRRGPDSTQWLWVESRKRAGTFDAGMLDQAANGVLVHLEDESLDERFTNLLHFNPVHAPNAFPGAPLAAGAVWKDLYSPLTLNVVSGSPPTVSAAYDTPCAPLASTGTTHSYAAQTGALSVSGAAGCSWVAASGANWITITAGQSGTGNGTVTYSLAVNAGSARTGILYVARQKYVVVQEGTPPGLGMNCLMSGMAVPLRVESLAELTGEVVINCTGGTPTPSGTAVPKVDFELTLNTAATGRVTAANWSEALLIVDEPHSVQNPAVPLLACGMPGSNDNGSGACSITGNGTGQNTYNGSAGHANVFQGQPGGANKITWRNVPIDPPGNTGSRTIRLTNIRANVNSLGLSGTLNPVQVVAVVAATPALQITNSPGQTVGLTSAGVKTSGPASASLSQCVNANAAIAADASKPLDTGGQNGYQFTVKLTEGFSTAWREKNVQWHLSNAALLPPTQAIADAAQDVPGSNYFSESGFEVNGATPVPIPPPVGYGPFYTTANTAFPSLRGLDRAGGSDEGTRLRVSFTNIPAGMKLFVPTAVNVVTTGSGAQQTGIAVLVATDANGAGAYVRAAGNASGSAPLNILNGVTAAVYEIVYADPFQVESVTLPVAAAYVANVASNQPAAGSIGVQSGFAPLSNTGTAGDSTVPLPRFATSGGSYSAFNIVACAAPDFTVAVSHAGTFVQGDTGRTISITATNSGQGPSAGAVSVSAVLPSGLTTAGISGSGWTCTLSPPGCTRGDSLPAGGSYPPVTVVVNVSATAPSSVVGTATVSGGGEAVTTNNSASDVIAIAAVSGSPAAAPLGFYPLTPCRVADTRPGQGKTGAFGPPILPAYFTREFPIPSSTCGVPSTAKAFSLNMTAHPQSGLDWLSSWPAGDPYPGVSTLNAPGGGYIANAALIPAGVNGGIAVVGGQPTDLIIDVNGYFAPPTAQELVFYPVTPCRVADTRSDQGRTGAFGPPSMKGYSSRDFPIRSSACGIPAAAQVYALNVTVFPTAGTLSFLSMWPAGQPYPGASTLNSTDGSLIANAALVPAGGNGAVTVVTGESADLIIDINGYFAPPAPGGLHFYTLKPCRVADTRAGQGKTGAFGPPRLEAYQPRDFPVGSACGVPAGAQAYSLNMTVIPPAPVDFLSMWPAGGYYPGASTLNAPMGRMIANAAIIPAGTHGGITVVVGKPTDLVIDINGYFAP